MPCGLVWVLMGAQRRALSGRPPRRAAGCPPRDRFRCHALPGRRAATFPLVLRTARHARELSSAQPEVPTADTVAGTSVGRGKIRMTRAACVYSVAVPTRSVALISSRACCGGDSSGSSASRRHVGTGTGALLGKRNLPPLQALESRTIYRPGRSSLPEGPGAMTRPRESAA